MDGKPTARIVLLKAYDQRGFVFYTNYGSVKGQQLTENPNAALVFWWGELERQVRIEGKVEKVAATETDDYFRSRPYDSQLGAWVSNQSAVIESRKVLEEKLVELKEKYTEKIIPRPNFWGGFRVIPNLIEFWQGRPSRLHDRLVYKLVDSDWVIERLSP
jgi:pyridoxamine 5'-phosphate oxidase